MNQLRVNAVSDNIIIINCTIWTINIVIVIIIIIITNKFPYDYRFSEGDEVIVEIDEVRRVLNARIHSAGHLLDSAFSNMGMTELIPYKVIMIK